MVGKELGKPIMMSGMSYLPDTRHLLQTADNNGYLSILQLRWFRLLVQKNTVPATSARTVLLLISNLRVYGYLSYRNHKRAHNRNRVHKRNWLRSNNGCVRTAR